MTETHATPGPAAQGPVFPPGRYGRRREPRRARRTGAWIVGGIVILAGFGLSVALYDKYGTPEYDPTVRRMSQLSDTQVTVVFDVRKPAGEPAVCTVRARTREGEEVGRARVEVPAGEPEDRTVSVTYTLRTTKRPVTVEVPGCGPVPGS